MRVTDTTTGEEFDALTLDEVQAVMSVDPNPEAEGEFFVDVLSPSGETVTMSVAAGTVFLVNPDGSHTVMPAGDAHQFEVSSNG